MRYELIIYWSKTDESFIVEVPELPGCMADGATYEEAVANAQIVVQEWIDTAKALIGTPHSSPQRQIQQYHRTEDVHSQSIKAKFRTEPALMTDMKAKSCGIH